MGMGSQPQLAIFFSPANDMGILVTRLGVKGDWGSMEEAFTANPWLKGVLCLFNKRGVLDA